MEKPDWVLWGDPYRSLTLEECVCLSLDSEPETVQHVPFSGGVRIYQYWHAEFKGALNTEKGKERLATLRKHFDSGSRLLPPQGRPDYRGVYAEKRVMLLHFAQWAHAMKWEVPEPLDITPTPDAEREAADMEPVAEVSALGGTGITWTEERKEAARAMLNALRGQGKKAFAANTAAAFGVSATRLREVLNDKPKKAPTKKVRGFWGE